MRKQRLIFADRIAESNKGYSSKIEAPVYEPKNKKPHLFTLCDSTKTKQMIREIDASELQEEEKAFLRAAAWRHAVFHYERIADYYAHASPEMQRLMEASALVIIDFDAAIEHGFVNLCNNIRKQYLEEYKGNGDAT